MLVSSLSIDRFPVKSISVRGSKVSPLKERGTRFPLPQVVSSHARRATFSEHLRGSRYQLVKVETQGRSIHEAAERGINALNLLRGLWSLLATYGAWSMRGGTPTRKPLGVIHAGPVHTLHRPDGRAASDELYWYDPDYIEDHELFRGDEKWEKIESGRAKLVRRLSRLAYRGELESLLIRYAGALDHVNPENAFLQMWSLLEKMTDTVGANYDETIKRTLWRYEQESRPLAKDMLESLRYRRNQYVHSGRSGQDGDQIAYLVKAFVDPHLLTLINNPFKVQSLREYGEFLSLPTDLATLKERRRRFDRAIRALGT